MIYLISKYKMHHCPLLPFNVSFLLHIRIQGFLELLVQDILLGSRFQSNKTQRQDQDPTKKLIRIHIPAYKKNHPKFFSYMFLYPLGNPFSSTFDLILIRSQPYIEVPKANQIPTMGTNRGGFRVSRAPCPPPLEHLKYIIIT